MGKGGATSSSAATLAAVSYTSESRSRRNSESGIGPPTDTALADHPQASILAEGEKPFWPTKVYGDTEFQRRRSFVWQIFENPEDTLVSKYINLYILSLIVISAVITVVETIPGLHREDESTWAGFEGFFVVNFTIEFVCRIVSCPDYSSFFLSGMNYIDIVSILPFYVDVIVGGSDTNLSVLRVLRLGRSLRLMKLSRYSRGIRLVTNAMEQSLDALQLFFFLLIIVTVVCSSAIYYTERGEYNEQEEYWERTNPMTNTKSKSPFQSIPQSFWWCIVTLTTVGYGDQYPITYGGQIVGTITMLLGLIMLALPLSIIGTNFIEERANMIRELELAKRQVAGKDGQEGSKADSQSLKSQLEETIDVINEVVKYQELIAESMGDAIKLVAVAKAEQMRRLGDDEGSGSAVLPYETPTGTDDNTTEEGSGFGAGVGEGGETGGGVGSITEEKTEKSTVQVSPQAEEDSGAIHDANLVPMDAAVINILEVLCKNVIKCCSNTKKAVL